MTCCIPSWDIRGIVPVLLGNPGILGQGCGCALLYAIPGCTWDNHGLLGNPGILRQEYGCELLYTILGYTRDSHGLLGNPGILGQKYVLYAILGCTWVNRESWDTWIGYGCELLYLG